MGNAYRSARDDYKSSDRSGRFLFNNNNDDYYNRKQGYPATYGGGQDYDYQGYPTRGGMGGLGGGYQSRGGYEDRNWYYQPDRYDDRYKYDDKAYNR